MIKRQVFDKRLFTEFVSGLSGICHSHCSKIEDIETDEKLNSFQKSYQIGCVLYGSSFVKSNISDLLTVHKNLDFYHKLTGFRHEFLSSGLVPWRALLASSFLIKDGSETKHTQQLCDRGLVTIDSKTLDINNEQLAEYVDNIVEADVAKNSKNLLISSHNRDLRKLIIPVITEVRKVAAGFYGEKNVPAIENQIRSNTFVQRVNINSDAQDHQFDPHIDTFFPALKFWLFPKEVKVDQGTFVYLEKSSGFSIGKLNWLRDASLGKSTGTNQKSKLSHKQGSLRIENSELSCYFDEEIKQIPVKAGTLLIANVFGMHSRGQSQINVSRRAIHGSIRFMPPYKKLSRQLLLVRHSISNAFHQL